MECIHVAIVLHAAVAICIMNVSACVRRGGICSTVWACELQMAGVDCTDAAWIASWDSATWVWMRRGCGLAPWTRVDRMTR